MQAKANSFLTYRFETQLTAVKERLEAAKFGSTRGLASHTDGPSGFSFGGAGSRIAKPLRGGGAFDGMNGGGPSIPTLSTLQAQGAGVEAGKKRSSWFFNQRS